MRLADNWLNLTGFAVELKKNREIKIREKRILSLIAKLICRENCLIKMK